MVARTGMSMASALRTAFSMMSSSSGGVSMISHSNLRGAKDLDITGDVLDLDQARVHRLAAEDPPLGQVSLIGC